MVWILLVAFSSICSVGQSTFTKIATAKRKTTGTMLFNALKVGSSLVFFLVIFSYNMQFHLPSVMFASAYGCTLFLSTFFGYMALMNGSMALTSTIVSYSVLIPYAFGIIFLDEKVSFIQMVGIALLLISMYLIKQQADSVKLSKRWLVYVVITFLCNGTGSVIQKLHQTAFPSSYCSEFMVYAITVTFLLFFVSSICKKEEMEITEIKYGVFAGILMGFSNYLTLTLSSKVNASVLFPSVTIFSMLCNVLVSKIYFKDKFSIIQLIGIGFGVISILLIK